MALSDHTVEAITHMILDGDLRPGDRLPDFVRARTAPHAVTPAWHRPAGEGGR